MRLIRPGSQAIEVLHSAMEEGVRIAPESGHICATSIRRVLRQRNASGHAHWIKLLRGGLEN